MNVIDQELCFVYFVYHTCTKFSRAMETVVERPTLKDQQVARESLPLFTKAIAQKESEQGSIQI